MANILNIDTSSSICSVAVSINGEIAFGVESSKKMDHSSSLAPFVEKALEFVRERNLHLDAVSISNGPGSYTGLRIGLSMGKGLCYGMNLPLIAISSLEIMAVRAIFTTKDFNGDELIIPMIDARRMEVYTCVYKSDLSQKEPQAAIILDENSFKDLKNERKVIFIGDGSGKFRNLYQGENALWLGDGMPHAKYMPALSEKYFKEGRFSDVAYTVPNYIKDYQTTKPKNPFPVFEKG